ncbi:MAG: DinB family protein [Dehalococcoidia bacterium]
MTGSADLIVAVAAAGEAYAAFVAGLDAAAFHRRPSEDAWTVAELTGHVSEFLRTFASHAARLAANPGSPVGRTLDDEGRLAALARVGDRSPAQAAGLVREAVSGAVETLRSILPGGWEAAGVRVFNGETITVAGLVETVILDHMGQHLAQARQAAGG